MQSTKNSFQKSMYLDIICWRVVTLKIVFFTAHIIASSLTVFLMLSCIQKTWNMVDHILKELM